MDRYYWGTSGYILRGFEIQALDSIPRQLPLLGTYNHIYKPNVAPERWHEG